MRTYKGLDRDHPTAASRPATDTNHGINENNKGLSPEPSGWVRRQSADADWVRAFSTTPVVAGLNAEPVAMLDGGPNGVRALNNATPIAIHRVSMKSSLPLMLSVL